MNTITTRRRTLTRSITRVEEAIAVLQALRASLLARRRELTRRRLSRKA